MALSDLYRIFQGKYSTHGTIYQLTQTSFHHSFSETFLGTQCEGLGFNGIHKAKLNMFTIFLLVVLDFSNDITLLIIKTAITSM